MPLKLSTISAERKAVAKQFPGTADSLTVSYRPHLLTPDVEAMFAEDLAGNRSLAATATLIAALIDEWDLLDDEGQPLPISEETLHGIGAPVLNFILTMIIEDLRPDPKAKRR